MDSHKQNSTSSPSVPIQCANSCGFFGNPSTNNMCSKCFRETGQSTASVIKQNSEEPVCPVALTECDSKIVGDHFKSESASPVLAPVITPPLDHVIDESPIPADAMDVTPSPVPTLHEEVGERFGIIAPPAPSSADLVVGTGIIEEPAAPVDPLPARKPQPKGRCYQCDKKVGLLGFECKCEFVFCGAHRHADQHACEFDFKGHKRGILASTNTGAVAEKVNKF